MSAGPTHQEESPASSSPEVAQGVAVIAVPESPPSAPAIPENLLASLISSPRVAVVSSDPARRLSPKRAVGTYLADDALRTLQFIAYTEGCETWRLLDTAVRAIARDTAANHHRFSSIVLAIVNSVPFQMRRAEDIATGTTADPGRPLQGDRR